MAILTVTLTLIEGFNLEQAEAAVNDVPGEKSRVQKAVETVKGMGKGIVDQAKEANWVFSAGKWSQFGEAIVDTGKSLVGSADRSCESYPQPKDKEELERLKKEAKLNTDGKNYAIFLSDATMAGAKGRDNAHRAAFKEASNCEYNPFDVDAFYRQNLGLTADQMYSFNRGINQEHHEATLALLAVLKTQRKEQVDYLNIYQSMKGAFDAKATSRSESANATRRAIAGGIASFQASLSADLNSTDESPEATTKRDNAANILGALAAHQADPKSVDATPKARANWNSLISQVANSIHPILGAHPDSVAKLLQSGLSCKSKECDFKPIANDSELAQLKTPSGGQAVSEKIWATDDFKSLASQLDNQQKTEIEGIQKKIAKIDTLTPRIQSGALDMDSSDVIDLIEDLVFVDSESGTINKDVYDVFFGKPGQKHTPYAPLSRGYCLLQGRLFQNKRGWGFADIATTLAPLGALKGAMMALSFGAAASALDAARFPADSSCGKIRDKIQNQRAGALAAAIKKSAQTGVGDKEGLPPSVAEELEIYEGCVSSVRLQQVMAGAGVLSDAIPFASHLSALFKSSRAAKAAAKIAGTAGDATLASKAAAKSASGAAQVASEVADTASQAGKAATLRQRAARFATQKVEKFTPQTQRVLRLGMEGLDKGVMVGSLGEESCSQAMGGLFNAAAMSSLFAARGKEQMVDMSRKEVASLQDSTFEFTPKGGGEFKKGRFIFEDKADPKTGQRAPALASGKFGKSKVFSKGFRFQEDLPGGGTREIVIPFSDFSEGNVRPVNPDVQKMIGAKERAAILLAETGKEVEVPLESRSVTRDSQGARLDRPDTANSPGKGPDETSGAGTARVGESPARSSREIARVDQGTEMESLSQRADAIISELKISLIYLYYNFVACFL